MSQPPASAPTPEDLNNAMRERRSRLEAIRGQRQAYPNRFRRSALTSDVSAQCAQLSAEELEARSDQQYALAGRVMTRRVMGKAAFLTMQDMGGRLQLYLRSDELPEGQYRELLRQLDLGDIIGVRGHAFRTRSGELTLHVRELELLVKSLRPLPEKFRGLTDPELRCRQRYLDLLVNEASRQTFLMRTRIVSFIRRYMDERRFMEVETPMMHVIPGGANARPFVTHHHALDIDMYLRIAPELYLKRLVVGGFERVYEINRNFRNEGIDLRHNPEFTMIEFYMAYADYRDLMDLTEDLFRSLAREVLGGSRLHCSWGGGDGFELDFDRPFDKLTMKEAVVRHAAGTISAAQLADEQQARQCCAAAGIEVGEGWTLGHCIAALFEELAEPQLLQPTFITSYPAAISPLARRSDDDPEFTDRFEFFIGGRELGNGFSELNDPDDQRERFLQQAERKRHGDDEAMYYDADYITALEHGLPPTAGEGLGIDRMVMLFTGSRSIRDVILFPALRPQSSS